MTTDTLTFPEIDAADLRDLRPGPIMIMPPAEPAALDLAKVDLTDAALAKFGDWRKATADTKADFSKLALDLSTQARIDDAISLRHRKVNTPLAEARQVSKALKTKLAAVSKAVGTELELIETAWTDVATAITPQIEAAQKKIDDAKAAAKVAEEARLSALRSQVDDIMARWAERCTVEGITAERIGLGIEMLQGVEMPPEVADVAAHWDATKAATLVQMRGLQSAALAREEAARLEAQRVENERVAADLAAQQQALAAQAAEIQRQADELDAAQRKARCVTDQFCQEVTICAPGACARAKAAEEARQQAERERRSQEAIDAAKAMAEAIEAAQQRAITPAAPTAEQGKADTPGPSEPEAAPINGGAMVAPAVDGVLNPSSVETLASAACEGFDSRRQDDGSTPSPATYDLGEPTNTTGEPRDQTPAEIRAADGPEVDLPPAADEAPTLKLGQIADRLGFALRGDFISRLGIEPAGRDKAAVLYRESQWPLIKSALVKHIGSLA